MSAVLNTPPAAATASADVNARLMFSKNLQNVTNKIHATSNIDEIMLEVSSDICSLFNADRLTIYIIGEDKQSIVSKVKTGLNSFKDLKLPVSYRHCYMFRPIAAAFYATDGSPSISFARTSKPPSPKPKRG